MKLVNSSCVCCMYPHNLLFLSIQASWTAVEDTEGTNDKLLLPPRRCAITAGRNHRHCPCYCNWQNLSSVLSRYVNTWNSYIVNGFRVNTREYDYGKCTNNCGIRKTRVPSDSLAQGRDTPPSTSPPAPETSYRCLHCPNRRRPSSQRLAHPHSPRLGATHKVSLVSHNPALLEDELALLVYILALLEDGPALLGDEGEAHFSHNHTLRSPDRSPGICILLQRQRLGNASAHHELYKKVHTHRKDRERTGQFVDNRLDEFSKVFCTLKAQKMEEHRQNGAPMPNDMELITKVYRQIAYANYILHKAVVVPLNAVGISMTELGSLKPPHDWKMPGYPSSEGTSYARSRGEGEDPRGENDDPRGEDDDHVPPS
ncbi:hypothetical protein M9H77_07281 [Catharanthus roseus]|uniref:Uncharacterized protein n=1 Tax=Catharanthus roseus TaxID=4058 RepID=A0ACC0BUR5_CATRO|nr:hypothetical protein M9H77_07281 [Catharanthus roseus]